MKPIDEYLLLGLVERCSWFNHAPKIIGIYADEPDLVERLIRVCWPDVTCVFWQEGQVPPVEGVVMASVWVGALNITKMCDNISSWVMPGGWVHWLALGDPSFSECGQEGVWPTAEAYCQTLAQHRWRDVVLSQDRKVIRYEQTSSCLRDLKTLRAEQLPFDQSTTLTLTLMWLHAWMSTNQVVIPIANVLHHNDEMSS